MLGKAGWWGVCSEIPGVILGGMVCVCVCVHGSQLDMSCPSQSLAYFPPLNKELLSWWFSEAGQPTSPGNLSLCLPSAGRAGAPRFSHGCWPSELGWPAIYELSHLPSPPLHSILNLFKRAFQGPKGIDLVLCGRILPSRRLVRVMSKFPICWLWLKSVQYPLDGSVCVLEKVVESEMQVRKVASWIVSTSNRLCDWNGICVFICFCTFRKLQGP